MDRPSEAERDYALSFHWKPVDFGVLDGLGLPPARNIVHGRARASILTEAYIIGHTQPNRWISYSRRRDFYTDQQRYRGTAYTYNTVVSTVDQLADFGLLENAVAHPGSRGRQSRFRATTELVDAFDRPISVHYDPHELIQLKDADGRLVQYRDTAETERMRRELIVLNDALAAVDVTLKAPGLVQDEYAIRCGHHVLYLAHRAYYRVFNGSFQRGGRLYGPWWQSAPSKVRPYIEIGGEPTVELDYPAHHLRMAYVRVHTDPPIEPYTLPGWERQLVKRAVLIMFNAQNYNAAIGAIVDEIGGAGARKRAVEVIQLIKAKHAPVAHLFHSDLGIKLQRQDADMAAGIVGRLLKKGVITLSIHDSFLTPMRYGGVLHEEMAAAWWRFVVSVNPSLRSVSYGNSIPQMERHEPCSVMALPLLVLLLPPSAQLELFDPPFASMTVPVADLDSWRCGRIPPSVRRGVEYEIKRRGIRLSDLARRLGISNQLLTCVMGGRSCAGSALANGLRTFIEEAAIDQDGRKAEIKIPATILTSRRGSRRASRPARTRTLPSSKTDAHCLTLLDTVE
jgi:hypothetical protein